jgi:hypothetical protein
VHWRLPGTFASNINPAGAIAGNYWDASGVSHGFLRARDGTITKFVASRTAMPPQIDSNHSELPDRETVNGLPLRERWSLCKHFLPESL